MKRIYIVAVVLAFASLSCYLPSKAETSAPIITATMRIAPTATTLWTATVRMEFVRVRSAPNGSTVAIIRKDTQVVIASCADDWCEIKEPAGYVWRGCLSDNPQKLGCRSK